MSKFVFLNGELAMSKRNYPRKSLEVESKILAMFTFNGKEVAKLARGLLKPPTMLYQGQLYFPFEGRRLYVSDLAWAKTYRNWPMFPLWHKNGVKFDCSIDNLLPIRLKRCRFRFVDGKHPLSDRVFTSKEPAYADWLRCFSATLEKDLAYCLNLEREMRGEAPVFPERPAEIIDVAIPSLDAFVVSGEKPKIPEGMVAYKQSDKWVVVKQAKNVADDLHLRVQAALGLEMPQITFGTAKARIISAGKLFDELKANNSVARPN